MTTTAMWSSGAFLGVREGVGALDGLAGATAASGVGFGVGEGAGAGTGREAVAVGLAVWGGAAVTVGGGVAAGLWVGPGRSHFFVLRSAGPPHQHLEALLEVRPCLLESGRLEVQLAEVDGH